MKIYVATQFANREQAADVMRELRARRHVVTQDSDAGLAGVERDRYLTACAKRDFHGVRDCDVFLLLDAPECRGAYTELGMALALEKGVVVVDGPRRNIFLQIPTVVHCASIGEAMDLIAGVEAFR
jgi:hypothetical protein